MTAMILEAQDIHYTYEDGTSALQGISLGVQRGKTTALLGGNGAGKSTLFLTMNGILKPTSGRLLWEGQPLDYSRHGLRQLRQKVGIVFQDPDNQLFSASVYQDISFGAVNLKLPDAEVRRRVEQAMAQTQITHLKDKPTYCLSYGQKKRVALAGILVMQPQVLILDEPTAGLDPKGASELMQLLMQTQKALGITVILATHDIDMVPLYCDEVYVMDAGNIVLSGSPQEVFAQKETLRKVNLRLPRIGHLMEILQERDGFALWDDALPVTISEARRAFKQAEK